MSSLNIPNLDRVIAAIEAEEAAGRKFKFDMRDYVSSTECGTSACIAGTAALLAYPDATLRGARLYRGSRYIDCQSVGGEFLGLSEVEAGLLFYGRSMNHRASITRPQALAVIRHLRDTYVATGEVVVDWSVAEAVPA